MKTRVTELLGIRYPIIQGGMAWVAENHLAAAVSEAGGFGLLGAASAPAEGIRREIRAVKAQTDRPFGVNIMLLSPYAEEVAHVVVEEGVTAVTTGAGSPEKYMKLWKDAGIRVIPVVASVALAKRMERCGADAVVAEGMESGGHIGSLTTMALLPQVVEAVQMGTRFVASKESVVHQNYKERILKARDIDSAVTGMSTGHPVRCLRNQMTQEYLKKEKEGASFEELEQLTLGSLRKAVQEGDMEAGTVMAGQIAGLIKKEETCREIIEEIMAEVKNLLGK